MQLALAYQDCNLFDGGIRSYNGGHVLCHAMTNTLSTTCSYIAKVRLHDLEGGFTKKKGGPAHQLVSARES